MAVQVRLEETQNYLKIQSSYTTTYEIFRLYKVEHLSILFACQIQTTLIR